MPLLMESVINHSAFPMYFFFSAWLPGTFCNSEVMRNKELTWISLKEFFGMKEYFGSQIIKEDWQ